MISLILTVLEPKNVWDRSYPPPVFEVNLQKAQFSLFKLKSLEFS
jgi:hypothetical protein